MHWFGNSLPDAGSKTAGGLPWSSSFRFDDRLDCPTIRWLQNDWRTPSGWVLPDDSRRWVGGGLYAEFNSQKAIMRWVRRHERD